VGRKDNRTRNETLVACGCTGCCACGVCCVGPYSSCTITSEVGAGCGGLRSYSLLGGRLKIAVDAGCIAKAPLRHFGRGLEEVSVFATQALVAISPVNVNGGIWSEVRVVAVGASHVAGGVEERAISVIRRDEWGLGQCGFSERYLVTELARRWIAESGVPEGSSKAA
jgi:hypothetical protein